MKKNLKNIEIANIIAYMNSEGSIIRNNIKLNTIFTWRLRKNMKRLNAINDDFLQAQQEIINYYSDDEYSYEKDGERLLKEEYVAEYNQKIQELYVQDNSVSIDMIKIDEIFPDGFDTGLSFEELDLLSFMIKDENDEDENIKEDKYDTESV